MRYFKTVVNGKLKRIDACDIVVSGEEITKSEYDDLKAELEEKRLSRLKGNTGNA